ncbi:MULTISPECIES: hypothetical protein [Flavobacterium]|uniref:Uncharacterized protein n=1 Tax=Flavobacterium jumunjinense TaxID=998845 RepID=A0ABV5GKJ3_9FLAO|nr:MULTISPECIES: hypothetical protein [Flavobacterium]
MKVTTYKTFDNTTAEQVEKLLKDKLGNKYEIKLSKKATSMAGKLFTDAANDSVTVIKNAYHRTKVNVATIDDPSSETGAYTAISYSEAKLTGWLSILHGQAGLLGKLVIRLIYGNADEFYEEVDNVIKVNIKGVEETKNVGIASLFNKKNS